MKKILFLHGFYASGQCVPAVTLKEAFDGEADVITPDLPMHPKEAVKFIRGLIDSEKPDLRLYGTQPCVGSEPCAVLLHVLMA